MSVVHAIHSKARPLVARAAAAPDVEERLLIINVDDRCAELKIAHQPSG
jgi:hypothetical protein